MRLCVGFDPIFRHFSLSSTHGACPIGMDHSTSPTALGMELRDSASTRQCAGTRPPLPRLPHCVPGLDNGKKLPSQGSGLSSEFFCWLITKAFKKESGVCGARRGEAKGQHCGIADLGAPGVDSRTGEGEGERSGHPTSRQPARPLPHPPQPYGVTKRISAAARLPHRTAVPRSLGKGCFLTTIEVQRTPTEVCLYALCPPPPFVLPRHPAALTPPLPTRDG